MNNSIAAINKYDIKNYLSIFNINGNIIDRGIIMKDGIKIILTILLCFIVWILLVIYSAGFPM